MAPWISLSRRSRTRPGTDASSADRFDDFVQLELERLEERCVLSVTAAIVMGELVISEDMAGDDEVSIQIDGGGDIEVFDNGMSIGTFSPDAITSGQITVDLGTGDDLLTLPVIQDDAQSFTISVDGGTGGDTINLESNAGTVGFLPSLSLTAEQIHLGGTLGSSYQTIGLALSGNVTLDGTVSIDTDSGNFSATGTLSGMAGTENLSLTAGGTATFGGAVSMLNDLTVNADGTTTFSDTVTLAGDLQTDTDGASGATVVTDDVMTGGQQEYADSVTLAGDVTFTGVDTDADGEGVEFGSTVAGGTNDLTVSGGGSFASAATGFGAFSADTLDTQAILSATTVSVTGAAELGGDVTTTGEQGYDGAVTLSEGVFLTAVDTDADGAGIDFGSTLAGGGKSLTISGGAAFAGAVSGVGAFSADAIDTASTLSAATIGVTGAARIGGNVTTTGQQTYGGGVTLTGNVMFTGVDTDADGEGVEFGSTVAGGSNALTVSGGGAFAAAVSGVTALSADSIDAESTLAASTVSVTGAAEIGGNVTTTGQQTYGGGVTLSGNVMFTGVDTDADGEGVEFGSMLAGGGNTLTIVGGGAFAGAVSGVTTFLADSIDTESTLSAATVTVAGAAALGGSVTTTGQQLYSGAVTLTGDAVLDSSAGNANVRFLGDVSGDSLLTVTAGGGNVDFESTVGNAASLSGLSVNGANVDFEGAVSVDDQGLVVTSSATTDVRGSITTTSGGTVQFANGGQLLLVDSISIDADGAVTQTGAGAVQTGADITTSGDLVTFASAVALTDTLQISTGAGAGNVLFSSTVNGAEQLTITAGTGNVTFSGAVGAGTALSGLTIVSAGDVDFDGTVTVSGAVQQQAGTGTTTISGAMTAASVSLTTADLDVLAAITATSGDITLTGDGMTTLLAADLTTAGGNITINDSVLVSGSRTLDSGNSQTAAAAGAIQITGPVGSVDAAGDTLTLDARGGTTDGTVTLLDDVGNPADTIGGSAAQRLNGLTVFGSSAALAGVQLTGGDLAVTADAITLTGSTYQTQTSGDILLSGPVAVSAASASLSAAGNVSLSSTLQGSAGTEDVSVTAGGTATFTGAVSMLNDLTVNADGTTTFGDTVDLAGDLQTDTDGASGTTVVTKDVTTSGQQVFADGVTLAGDVTFTGVDTDADGEGVEFGSTLAGGNNTLTIMGGGAFVGAVTNVTTFGADSIDTEATLTASTVTVSGTADLGGDVTTTGEQQYGGAVTLTGDVLLTGVDTDANGAGVEFAGTVTGGGNDLTIMGGGLFAAAVSGVGAFAADTIDTESTLDASTVTVTGAAEIGGDVTTTGDQEYGGAVTLTADVTFTGVDLDMDGAGVEFSQLVDGGGNGLAVAGGAAFDNGIVNVSSLTVIGATTIAGDVTTTGQQVYDGPVTLAANVVLTGVDTDADGEGVEFGSTLAGGGNTLTIVGGGAFAGAVSGVTTFLADSIDTESTLAAMTVTVTGAAELGGDVTTTGLQSWGGAVTISGDTELDSSAGGGNIIFVADVSGDALLTVTAGTGDVTFQSTIGGVTPLSGLVLTANSVDFTGAIAVDDQGLMVTASTTTNLEGSITATNGGSVQFSSAVALTDTLQISTGAGAGNVQFGSTVNGAEQLTITAGTGNVTFSGAVGAGTALSGLTIVSAGDVDFDGTVTVSGAVQQQAGTGTTTISGAMTATSVSLTTVDLDVLADITATGGDITLTGGGSKTLLAADLTTAGGNITINDSVLVSGSRTVDSGNGQTAATAGAIQITGPVGSVDAAGDTLTLDARGGTTDGTVTLLDDVGNPADTIGGTAALRLNGLTVFGSTATLAGAQLTGGDLAVTAGAITLTGSTYQTQTTGDILLSGPVTVSATSALLTAAGNVSLSSTLQGAAGTENVSVTAGGTATFTGAVSMLNDLTVNADGTTTFSETVVLAGDLQTDTDGASGTTVVTKDVTTGGEQEYADAVILAGDVTFTGVDNMDAGSAGVEFASTVTGAGHALTVVGGGHFTGAVSGVTDFTADTIVTESTLTTTTVTVTGTSVIGGDVTTTGEQSYGDQVTLTTDVTFIGVDTDADGAGLQFFGLVDGGGNSMTVTGGVNFYMDVINVSVLDVTGTTIISADVTSIDQQFYAGPVLLLADVTLSGVDTDGDGEGVEFASSVLGSGHSLTIVGGGSFAGAVNSVANFTADTIDTESTFSSETVLVTGAAEIGGDVTTTGQQEFEGPVTLTSGVTFTGVDTDADGEGVEFRGPVIGGFNSLTVVGGGSFASNVSGVLAFAADHIDTEAMLSAITIDVSGTAEIAGDVMSSGTQTWGGAVTLETDVSFTKPGGRGWIEFLDDVSGNVMMTVDADFSGVTFAGTVGGVTPLSGLSVNGSIIEFQGDVVIDDEGLVVTSMSTTDVGGSITTTGGGTVQFANGGLLTLDNSVVINADGAVTQTGAGAVQTGADISTTGDQISFATAVTLTDDVSLTTAGGDVSFAATVDASTAGGQGLLVDAGTAGDVMFAAAVGATTRLGAVTIVDANDVTLATTFAADSLVQQAGSGTTRINGDAILFGATGIEISTQTIDVNASIDVQSAAAGGPLRLLAGDDLLINGALLSGTGLVDLTAGNDVTFTTAGSLSSTDGPVTVTADANGDANGTGGALTMADGSRIDSGTGIIRLSADEDVTLSSVVTTNGTIDAITITSTSGAIVDGGDGDIDLVANTPGARVTIDAVSGVGATGPLGALETTVAGLLVTNSTSGDIAIVETDSLLLAGAVQGGAGDVSVSTGAGSLTVTGGPGGPSVRVNGGSTIDLAAGGAMSDLVIDGGVEAGTGTVTLTGDRDVQFGADGDVTTAGGNVVVTADNDANGSGSIVMDDAALIDAAAGTIALSANGDITLGGLQSTSSADDAVTIISTAGGILDGGDTFVDVVTAGGQLVVQTAAGVGSADAIETQVDRIDIVNSTSGSVGINEVDDLVVERISQAGPGDVTVTTGNGTLTVVAGGAGITAAQGTVSLTAGGAAADVLLQQAVTTTGGDIAVQAGRDVTSTANGILRTTAPAGVDSGSVSIMAGGTGVVTLAGTIDTTGAAGGAVSAGGDVTITTEDGSVTLTTVDVSGGGTGGNSGSIAVTAGDAGGQLDGDVVLTSTLTVVGSAGGTDGTVSLTAGGDIVDANDGMTQITTGDLALSAATNIGTITDFVAGTGNAIDVEVSGKLTQATITEAGGQIFLNVIGDLQAASGSINPDADGAATFLLKTTGALDLGTDAGVFTLTDGDNLGLDAGTTLTLPDSGLNLGSGSLRLRGGTDVVDAAGRDLGLLVASDLSFVSGAAGGTTTLQTSVDTLFADLTTAPTGAGLVVNENDAITLTQITTNSGDVTVNAGLVGAGDITVVSIVASGADVVLDTATTGGAIVDGGDTEIDIVANGVALRAVDGIADGDRLEIDATVLAAATQRGDINVIDPSSGLVIGTVAGTAGLSITAGGVDDDIAVDALGAVTVDAAVRNVGGGDVTLAARGQADDRDLNINAMISTVGGNGAVSLFAGDTISVGSTGGAETSGTGLLTVLAATHIDDAGAMQNGTATGSILMQSGAVFGAEDGDILLQAPGEVAISRVDANRDGDASVGNVTIVADFNGVAGGLSDGLGAVTDSSTDESANVVAADLDITSATGVGGPDGLETDAETLSLTNRVSGDVIIHEVVGSGDNGLVVSDLSNLLGHVHVETFDGDLTMTGVVETTTSGNVTLIAGDADGDGNGSLNLQAAVTTQTGQVTLTSAGDDVTFTAAADVTTDGTIQVNSGVAGVGKITLADGTVLDAGSGQIELNGVGDVTIGRVVTTSTSDTAVSIASTQGAVIDAGDTGGVDVDVTGGRLVILAANGIGSGNAVETHVESLDVRNTANGHVSIQETDEVEIVRLGQEGSGDLSLTAAGTVTVLDGQPGVSAMAGRIQIEATGTGSDVQLDGRITSTTGEVAVHADDDVAIAGSGRILSTSGAIEVLADADFGRNGSSGAIVMSDGSLVDAGSGDVTFVADGAVTLGRVATTGMVSLTTVGGGIVDGGDSGGADVSAGSLVIRSLQGIGTDDSLDTSVSRLAAINDGGGDVRIDNSGAGRLTIDTVDDLVGISLTGSSMGQIVITNGSPLDVDGAVTNLTGGGIALTASNTAGAGDDLTVNAQIAAPGSAGHIVLDAGDDLIIHDAGVTDDVIGATVIGMAGDQVIITSDVLVSSATGTVAQPVPLISDIDAPPVEAIGRSLVTVEFGRPGEANFVVAVDRSDGTIQTAQFSPPEFVGPTTVTFEHTFDSNPNKENPSAPIVNTVFITDDPNITFFEAGEELRLDPIEVLSPIPGEGLLGGFVFDLSIDVPQLDPPRSMVGEAISVTPRSNIETGDVIDVGTVIENESAGDTQLVMVQKIAPDGSIETGQDGRPIIGTFTGEQAQEVLDDIPGLISKLRDGHFRIYLKDGKDGRLRLVDEFVIADGQRVFGNESTRDRPPTGEDEQAAESEPVQVGRGRQESAPDMSAGDREVPARAVDSPSTDPSVDADTSDTRPESESTSVDDAEPAPVETELPSGPMLESATGTSTERESAEPDRQWGALLVGGLASASLGLRRRVRQLLQREGTSSSRRP